MVELIVLVSNFQSRNLFMWVFLTSKKATRAPHHPFHQESKHICIDRKHEQASHYRTSQFPLPNLSRCSLEIAQPVLNRSVYTGLFEMIVGVLTTCHTQYT
jgi:hypothetical protein